MSKSFERELDILVDGFHSQERLRIWSLVITIFGDSVLPRGGEFWLGSLQEVMQRLRVEPNALRAAMSRLTADGWLIRSKVGRKSFYRLAEAGEEEFAAGTEKIYTPKHPSTSNEWTMVVLTGEAGGTRDARRAELRSDGFGALSPTVFIRSGPPPNSARNAAAGELVFCSQLADGSAAKALVAGAWPLDTIEAAYERLIDQFAPLDRALNQEQPTDPLSAIAARSLLIHNFRRAALRDPLFPPDLRPNGWKGDAARQLVSRIYSRLAQPSESWLDLCPNSAGAMLDRPSFDVARRFDIHFEQHKVLR